MHHCKELRRKIQAHVPLHGARLDFIIRFVMALTVVRSVTSSTVASALNPKVLPESNEKRIKRFLRTVGFGSEMWLKLALVLLPVPGKLVLTLDRTTWKLGKHCFNVLLLGVAYQGTAFPLAWTVLDKEGNVLDKAAPPGPVRSDTAERLALLDTLLEHVEAERVEAERVEAIVADREFIGQAWFRGLKARDLVFVMRLRNNTLVGSKGVTCSALRRYGHLEPRDVYISPKRCTVLGLRLYLAVTKSREGELVVLACNAAPERALVRYAQRWNSEMLFSALKSRGFNLEDTHLTTPERLDKLLALLALAFTWAHLVGIWCHEQKPLNLKNHGYPPKSLFKRGLDALRSAILTGAAPAPLNLTRCLQLLSP